jgi:hypothetical protein
MNWLLAGLSSWCSLSELASWETCAVWVHCLQASTANSSCQNRFRSAKTPLELLSKFFDSNQEPSKPKTTQTHSKRVKHTNDKLRTSKPKNLQNQALQEALQSNTPCHHLSPTTLLLAWFHLRLLISLFLFFFNQFSCWKPSKKEESNSKVGRKNEICCENDLNNVTHFFILLFQNFYRAKKWEKEDVSSFIPQKRFWLGSWKIFHTIVKLSVSETNDSNRKVWKPPLEFDKGQVFLDGRRKKSYVF